MKVKVLDIDLVRRYGSAIIDMDLNMAIRMKKLGKVKFLDDVIEYDFPDVDEETVIIFEEDKTILKTSNKEIAENKRVPAPDEPIFPQINMGGNK